MATSPGLQAQIEAYTRRPGDADGQTLPYAVEEWERRARERLSPARFSYVACGAGAESTMRANRDAFYRVRICPRMGCGVAERELAIAVLGTPSTAPFLLAPIGVQGILHTDGERAVARAAAARGIPFVLSTVSSVSLEEIAQSMGDAPRWFQLYPGRSRDLMSSMMRRADTGGYRTIVVTLDTTMLGWREADLANGYLPFLAGDGLANYFTDPVFLSLLGKSPGEDLRAAIATFLQLYVNPGLDWGEIAWIRSQTRLPVLVKGILHPDDADLALKLGVDGIIVSNHGGRQVDGAVAALDALPGVVARVGGRVPVLMDSGVRRGSDVLKALALGADAVLLGRPYAYALAVAGEEGVRRVIDNLTADIDLELGLAGRRSVRDLDRSFLATQTRNAGVF